MTVTDLLSACRRAGIVLSVTGDYIDVDAPAGALTPDLRGALGQHKPHLLEVLWRLQGMLQHRDPIPTAKSAADAPGGPGRCFSCGDRLDHPQAYGRCDWCCIAADVFHSTDLTVTNRTMVSDVTTRASPVSAYRHHRRDRNT